MKNERTIAALKEIEIFKAASKNDLEKIAGEFNIKNYQAGGTIFQQGEESNRLFFLANGEITVSQDFLNGKSPILFIYLKGELFGDGCLENEFQAFTATSRTESMILSVNKNRFWGMLKENPSLSLRYINTVNKMMCGLFRRMSFYSLGHTQEQVTASLLFLKERQSDPTIKMIH